MTKEIQDGPPAIDFCLLQTAACRLASVLRLATRTFVFNSI